jgi:hypothetical protein
MRNLFLKKVRSQASILRHFVSLYSAVASKSFTSSRHEQINSQTYRAEMFKVRITGDPCATMLQCHCGMLGIGYQFALCIRGSTEFLNQLPMALARADPIAILQCSQGVDHSKSLMERCGNRSKTGMGYYADEGNGDERR